MDNMSDFVIKGKISNLVDGSPMPDLYIEAWDKDLIFDDLVAGANSDSNGEFSLQFSEAHFRECFFDRYPDIFFKVYEGNRLLLDSSHDVICNLKPGTQYVTIEIDYKTEAPAPGDLLDLRGALIDTEVLFQFRRSLSKILAGFDSRYPPGSVNQLSIPFDGVADLLDMASAALSGNPRQIQRYRETLWSFGGKIIPTGIGIRIFRQHDGDRFIGGNEGDDQAVKLTDAKQTSAHAEFVSNYDNSKQLIDLTRLEQVMAAAAYSASDVAELATLAGSIELALHGADALNMLFRLTLENADPIDIASAFDTAVRISRSGFNPPFEGFTPGDNGFDLPGFIPGGGAPWYEWPLPAPGDPFPGVPGDPVPRVPDLDSSLVDHFEECFLTSIIPEMHRTIGFGGGINYVIENVAPDNACPGTTITLEGQHFDGTVEVRYGKTTATTSVSSLE